MLDGTISTLHAWPNRGRHSVSGLSSGAFMTVQLHVAHSASLVGAGVIAGGPYRAAQSYRAAAPTAASANILNSLYVAMTPLTASTAPDPDALVALARDTAPIDDLAHLKDQRVYIFTGRADRVVNQHAVRSTKRFYENLGVRGSALKFVSTVDAGHSIITTNPEDNPLDANRPPYINRGTFIQAHDILNHIYPDAQPPAQAVPGDLIRFEQAPFAMGQGARASLAEFGYAYIPSRVVHGDVPALGVHVVLHGCKQGYSYVDYVHGRPDLENAVPFGLRYVRSTGYLEWAEANDLIVLFPQARGGDAGVQNPDGCWDWWGYSAENPLDPDFYTQDAVQIRAIHGMLTALAAGQDAE